MRRYIDKSGASAVTHYERTIDGIKVRFSSGHEYHYTHASAGVRNIQRMQQLAESGQGLAGFIQSNQPGHSSRRKV